MADPVMTLVTDEVVSAALTSDKGSRVKLVSWGAESFTAKFDGATSTIKNLRVKYLSEDQQGEVSYVVKISPRRRAGQDEDQQDFFGMIFAKECGFYAEIIPALNAVLKDIGQRPLSFPKCVYFSLSQGNEMLLLENLQEKGLKMQNRAVGIDTAHTSLVLEELARLHAASVLLKARTPEEEEEEEDLVDRFDCLKKEWTKEFNLGCDFQTFAEGYLDTGVEIFEKIGGCDAVVTWLKKIKPQVSHLYEKMLVKTPPFTVITHGDCWINNLLFRYDDYNKPVEVKLLDLQGCRVASPATDLQHLFNVNLTDSVRRPNLDTFLATYHEAFSSVMKAGDSTVPFTLQELRQEYIAKGFYGVLYGIMWLPNMVRRPEDMGDILDSSEENKNSERQNAVRMVDTNPFLKPRLLSLAAEWTEFGVIS